MGERGRYWVRGKMKAKNQGCLKTNRKPLLYVYLKCIVVNIVSNKIIITIYHKY